VSAAIGAGLSLREAMLIEVGRGMEIAGMRGGKTHVD